VDRTKKNEFECYAVCMRQGERERKFNQRTYVPTVVCGNKTFAADQLRMSRSHHLQQRDAVTGSFRSND